VAGDDLLTVSSRVLGASPYRRPLPARPLADRWVFAWQRALAVTCVVVLFLELPLYAHVLNPGFAPKIAYFGFAAAAAPVLLARFDEFVDWLTRPFAVWVACFALLHVLHLIAISPGGHPEVVASMWLRIQMLALTLILGFVLVSVPPSTYLWAFPVLAVVLAGLLAFDFARPWALYPPRTEGVIPGRAAATLLNANKAGEAMMLITLFGLAALPRRLRPLLLVAAAVGVVATFGRNAMLAWIVAVGLLVATRAVSAAGAATLFGAGIAGGLLAGALVEFASNTPELTRAASDLAARLGFFTSGRVSDDSASERLTVALAALDLFFANPLLGAGSGSTYLWALPVSPHNLPLTLAAEFGLVGLAGWIWAVVLLWRGRFFAERPLQIVGTVLFVFYSMFSHSLLDFAYWLLAMALLASRLPVPAGAATPAGGRR
jgi:hypothetical protein